MSEFGSTSGRSGTEESQRSCDVAIVGGGLIGLGIAWKLAERGATVCVLDRTPLRGASWVGAGMLAPVTEVHFGEVPLLRLNLRSAELYPQFVAELEASTGRDVDFRPGGILLVAKDQDDRAALDELCRYQQQLGLDARPVSPSECREIEPLLAPGIRGGVFAGGDCQVDTRKLGEALLDAATKAGARLLQESVSKIQIGQGDRVEGVVTDSGRSIAAPVVVLAAGCWSPLVEGLPPGLVPPVRPVKGQLAILRLSEFAPGLRVTVRAQVHGRNVYLVKRSDGRLVLGGTVEEMGYDTRVTAGALLDLLRDAYEIVPTIVEYEILETLAGLRPGTPDNAPVLGKTPVDGLIYATGHFRNGILLTPITAYSIADLVTTGETPSDIEPFSINRFLGMPAA
jgi:glycine oxidase